MKKKWYASDMAFKIYSLLIALLLWVFVIYDQNPESTKVIRNVPVYYSNLDALENEGYTVCRGEEELAVDLKIKGRRLTLGKLSKKSVNAYVTFGDLKSGEYDLSVAAVLPESGLSVADKRPATIHVKVEKLVEKKIDVGIEYSGSNEEGKLASAELKTTAVTVSGPESVINKVSSAKIALDYETVMSQSEGQSKIILYDSDLNDITENKNIKLSDREISWESKIYNVKDVSLEMIFAGSGEYTMEELKISENAVKLCCSDDKTLDFDSVKTYPVSEADVEKIKAGESVEVTLNLPQHVSVLRQDANGRWTIADNNSVKIEGKVVHVEKIPLKSETNFEIRSRAEGKEYSITEKPEFVFVKCSESDSGQLWNTVFYVNAANLDDGEHTLAVEADLPEGAQMMQNYEAKITVKSKN